MTDNQHSRNRELLVFFALAYGITWTLWVPLILGPSGFGLIHLNVQQFWYICLGTLGPTAAALITHRIFRGNWRAFRIWSGLQPVVLGMLAGSALILVACFATVALSTQSGYGLWKWGALLKIPGAFLPSLLGGPLTEEPGWRGFALPRLEERFHPVTASVILGLLWANWHLPLLLMSFYTSPYLLYVPFVTAVSVIIGFGFNLSGKSIVTAIYLHGVFNVAIGVFLNDFLGKAVIRPTLGTICGFSFLGVALVVVAVTRGRLGAKPRSGISAEAAPETGAAAGLT